MLSIFNSFVILSEQEFADLVNTTEDLRIQVQDAHFELMERTQGGAKIQWDNWNNRQLEDLLKELEQVIADRKKHNQESCLANLQRALKNTISAFDGEDFKNTLEEVQQKIDDRG